MKRQVLGLDINDDFIAAAVVIHKGQEKQVSSWARREVTGRHLVVEAIASLLEEVGWTGGTVAGGMSLSGISLRNLTIPFTDRKNINQVLPLELEDQLIVPVQEQAVEYLVTERTADASRILVAAMEKETLHGELDMLGAGGVSPRFLTLRSAALAEAYTASGAVPRDYMLLDAGIHFMTMVIVNNGRIVFMRQLPCPERIFTREPFTFAGGRAGIADFDEAMTCLDRLFRDIRYSLGVFRIDTEIEYHPQTVVLTGIMSTVEEFAEKFSTTLNMEVMAGNLLRDTGTTLRDRDEAAWEPAVMDHALALALQAPAKNQINFRRGEFAPQRQLLTSRAQVVGLAAAGALLLAAVMIVLAVDYRALRNRYDQLGSRMEDMYRETFPGATRIQDALVQMQANVRNIQAPSIATPVFSAEQRTLNFLADISALIPESVVIHVSRLVIDQDSVQIKGNTDTFNNVNIIQSRLRESSRFDEVSIISAAAEKDSGLIRFELRLQTGGRQQ